MNLPTISPLSLKLPEASGLTSLTIRKVHNGVFFTHHFGPRERHYGFTSPRKAGIHLERTLKGQWQAPKL